MKKFLTLAALCCAVLCRAQTNIAFTSITVIPSPVLTNRQQITLQITNLTPGWTYSLPFSPYFEAGEQTFVPYIRFSSPSNSIAIVRQTTSSLKMRFYEVAPYGFTGLALSETPPVVWMDEESYWDTHDPVCEACEQQQFLSDLRATLTRFGFIDGPSQPPQEVLDIINPPPLRGNQ